jgi:peptidoglycan/LPS O-acetylase OafA/YrhL
MIATLRRKGFAISWEDISPVYQPVRLPSLDGWRAAAILLVVLSHFTATRGFPEPWWWTRVFQGNLGVRIFFVISGLLITYLLLAEADRRGRPSLRSFYTRRVLRIFPVYFFYLGVLLLLVAAGLYSDTATTWIGSLTFTRNLMGKADSLTGHYWSLSVEEQFYLVWPIMLVTLRLWKRPRLAVALLCVPIVLCPVFRTGIVQARWPNRWIIAAMNGFSTTMYADSLAVGCLGAYIYRAYRERLARATFVNLAVAFAVFVAASAATGRAGSFEPLLPLIQAVAVLFLILATIERRTGLAYRALNTALAVQLGVLSYSLYVWQELFISWSAGPKLSTLPVYDWRVWWLPALACACVSYYVIERPILRIRDRYRQVKVHPAALS